MTEEAKLDAELVKKITYMYNRVLEFFQENDAKTCMWFEAKNPLLGDYSPMELIQMGRIDRVKSFIDCQLDENSL